MDMCLIVAIYEDVAKEATVDAKRMSCMLQDVPLLQENFEGCSF